MPLNKETETNVWLKTEEPTTLSSKKKKKKKVSPCSIDLKRKTENYKVDFT